jgi:hypothetical protein
VSKRLQRSAALTAGAWLLAAAAAAAGCSAGGKQEAAQVIEGMDRFRRADNAAKPSMVETLRAVKCSSPDVCKARDACLASAEATAKALRLKSEVEQGLAAVETGAMPRESAEAKALPAKLDEAESLLKEGFAALPRCDDELMALKRKHQL